MPVGTKDGGLIFLKQGDIVANGYRGPERRKPTRLSDEEFHALAKEVKKLALDEIYADIGKGVVKRVLWLLGLGSSGAVAWMTYKGYIK